MRRRHIGIVFQFFNLLEGMTVLENVVDAGADRRPQAQGRPRRAPATCSTCSASATRPSQMPGRAVRRPAPAAGDRPRARQRADAAARRRADRRARLRGRRGGARAVPPPARRAARRSCWSPTTSRSPTRRSGSCGCVTAGSSMTDISLRPDAIAAARARRARVRREPLSLAVAVCAAALAALVRRPPRRQPCCSASSSGWSAIWALAGAWLSRHRPWPLAWLALASARLIAAGTLTWAIDDVLGGRARSP